MIVYDHMWFGLHDCTHLAKDLAMKFCLFPSFPVLVPLSQACLPSADLHYCLSASAASLSGICLLWNCPTCMAGHCSLCRAYIQYPYCRFSHCTVHASGEPTLQPFWYSSCT